MMMIIISVIVSLLFCCLGRYQFFHKFNKFIQDYVKIKKIMESQFKAQEGQPKLVPFDLISDNYSFKHKENNL